MTLTAPQLHDTPDPLWFCLKTQPRREHLAAAALRRMDCADVLSPRIRFRRPTRRGPVWFVEAMFPGYVFARFHYASQHRQAQSCPGVASVVTFGDRVGVLAPALVEQIRSAAGQDELLVYAPEPQVGDTVTIAEGSFQGLQAVITQLLPARDRVKVLLEFLGRDLEAEVAAPSILPVDSPRRSFAA